MPALRTAAFIAFCTDDRSPLDLAEEGHVDHLVRRAIDRGAECGTAGDPVDIEAVSS